MTHPGRKLYLVCCALLPLLQGCGNATVSGKVTFDGQPIEKGKISFLPADDKGSVVGTDINGGSYIARDVPPGKKKVEIVAIDTSISRVGSKKKADKEPLIPPEAIKGLTADLVRGTQEIDFPLKKP